MFTWHSQFLGLEYFSGNFSVLKERMFSVIKQFYQEWSFDGAVKFALWGSDGRANCSESVFPV